MSGMKPGPIPWWKWAWLFVFVAWALGLRMLFGLWCEPVQPMSDEIQTYLLGLKYAVTGEWPFYGNDVIKPPENLELLTQDPGALEGLLIGLPLKVWPSPEAPFLLANLISLAGFCLLAWYASCRLPQLPRWFIYPWVLLAPWCVHYTTNIMELSYSIPAACLFFVALFESLPGYRLGNIPYPLANALMGLSVSAWVQLHRTWVMLIPLLALSFLLQWRAAKDLRAPGFFLLGFLPLTLSLLLPTFFQGHYQTAHQASTFFYGFNRGNFLAFFKTLVQFLALACFEMPRFIGIGTRVRMEYLQVHGLIVPGVYLWYMGFLQVLVLAVYFFIRKNPHPEWRPLRFLTIAVFFWFYGCLLFTIKNPDVNTFVEMLPLVMLYSFYVWERLWTRAWPRRLLMLLLFFTVIFQTAYPFVERSAKRSFYLQYHDRVVQALAQHDYRVVSERRPGALY
jgi:hypothetical protein